MSATAAYRQEPNDPFGTILEATIPEVPRHDGEQPPTPRGQVPPPPPPPPLPKNGRVAGLVERRLQEARALYQASDILDNWAPPDRASPLPSITVTSSKSPSHAGSRSFDVSRGADPRRPRSVDINRSQTPDAHQTSSPVLLEAKSFSERGPRRSIEAAEPQQRRRRSKTPDRRRRRSKTPGRRGRGSQTQTNRRKRSKTPDARGKGLLKKIFGRGKKKTSSEETIVSEVRGRHMNFSPENTINSEISGPPPAPEGAEKLGISTSHDPVDFAHDDVSTLTSPTWESKRSKEGPVMTTNLLEKISISSSADSRSAGDTFFGNRTADPDGLSPQAKSSQRRSSPPVLGDAFKSHSSKSKDPPLFLQSLVDGESDEEKSAYFFEDERKETDFFEPKATVYEQNVAEEEKKEEAFESVNIIPPPPPSEPKKKKSRTPRHKKKKKNPKVLSQKTNEVDNSNPPENKTVSSTLHDSDTGEVLSLTVADAARLNAMSVAYLHKVDGQPAPKDTWHQQNDAPQLSPTDSSMNSTLVTEFSEKTKPKVEVVDPKSKVPAWQQDQPMARNVEISSSSVSKGFSLYRERRQAAIASGEAQPVSPVKQLQKSKPNPPSPYGKYEDSEPSDPIQRAGRRLLAKAAVPIQAAARMYLAQQKAIDRMWALIELQSYARRWRAEAHRKANLASAVTVQSIFRGYKTRSQLQDQNAAAVQIQKVMRSYLAAAATYDAVYRIILIQARTRGNLTRNALEVKGIAATFIQSAFRGFQARQNLSMNLYCVTAIQSCWRRHAAMKNLKATFAAREIQRVWRGHACVEQFRKALAAITIQRVWRGHAANADYTEYRAARKIQSIWRGFQCYTDYIFALVDIMVLQRSARRFLAQKRVEQMRVTLAAIKIQSCWRRTKCQTQLLYDFAHLIMAQSVARRFLCRHALDEKRDELAFRNEQATKIQSTWRGFWGYSHYVIVQYETVRLQAIIRGVMARAKMHLQLGCCIMIQSIMRQKLAGNEARRRAIAKTWLSASSMSLREKNACQSIQFWWRVVLDCRKEKQAALVIERFFIMVREEVERETERVLLKKQSKKEKRRRKKEAQEKLGDKIYLRTVDEDQVEVFAMSESQSLVSPSSTAASVPTPRSLVDQNHGSGIVGRHRASSPTMNMVLRHDRLSPKDSERISLADSASEISGFSGVSLGFNRAQMRKTGFPEQKGKTKNDAKDSYRELNGRPTSTTSKRLSSAEKYKKKYGLSSVPNRSSRSQQQFFSDDVDSVLSAASNIVSRNRSGRKSMPSVPTSNGESSTRRSPNNRASAYRMKNQPSSPAGMTTPLSRRSPSAKNGPPVAMSSPYGRRSPSARTGPPGSPMASPHSRTSPAARKAPTGYGRPPAKQASNELDKAFGGRQQYGMI